jgi:antitoxin component of MazEF toxin-antitoxin module
MVKNLMKVGNSNAVLLDRSLMEAIGLEEGGQIQLTVRDGCIVLAPVSPKFASPEAFRKAAKEFIRDNDAVLRKLAK